MNTCKSCKFWDNGECNFVNVPPNNVPPNNVPQRFEIVVRVSDDHNLAVSLKTGPDFGCVHHSAKQGTTLGNLSVETDYDFSIELNGTIYTNSEFEITINSIEELNAIKVLGPWGTPSGGKTWEINDALEAIKANPKEFFNNMGGNRGATWYPADWKWED